MSKPELMPCRTAVIGALMKAFGDAFMENKEANAAEFVTACLNAAQNVSLDVILGKAPLDKVEQNRMLLEAAVLDLYNAIHGTRPGHKEVTH